MSRSIGDTLSTIKVVNRTGCTPISAPRGWAVSETYFLVRIRTLPVLRPFGADMVHSKVSTLLDAKSHIFAAQPAASPRRIISILLALGGRQGSLRGEGIEDVDESAPRAGTIRQTLRGSRICFKRREISVGEAEIWEVSSIVDWAYGGHRHSETHGSVASLCHSRFWDAKNDDNFPFKKPSKSDQCMLSEERNSAFISRALFRLEFITKSGPRSRPVEDGQCRQRQHNRNQAIPRAKLRRLEAHCDIGEWGKIWSAGNCPLKHCSRPRSRKPLLRDSIRISSQNICYLMTRPKMKSETYLQNPSIIFRSHPRL